MYIPKALRNENLNEQIELMNQYPLATLITQHSDGVQANHIPIKVVQEGEQVWLTGHLARGNPMWKTHLSETPALAVFMGPNTYISPSFYPSKRVDGRAVPTWNYAAVHARGQLEFIQDEHWLLDQVTQQTNEQEAHLDNPWQVNDAPAEYLDKMLKAIVGFRIRVTNLQGKWKVSQNQPEANQAGVIAGLTEQGHDTQLAMAKLVSEHGHHD